MALEKYWRPFDFTLSFPARKNDSCFAHNILNILNILNIWTFEQKLQWYLVKKFLCSARASTIPPKKTYSLSRKKNRNPCLLGCTPYLHIRVKINQKWILWKWVLFCIMKRGFFLCKVILALKCCQMGKKWIFKLGSHRFEKTNILVIL